MELKIHFDELLLYSLLLFILNSFFSAYLSQHRASVYREKMSCKKKIIKNEKYKENAETTTTATIVD